MYIYCGNCGWGQDDYWHKGYNPIRFLLNDEENVLQPDLDVAVPWDKNTTYRQVVLAALEKATKKVQNMVYTTREQERIQNPEHLCPVCKQHSLRED